MTDIGRMSASCARLGEMTWTAVLQRQHWGRRERLSGRHEKNDNKHEETQKERGGMHILVIYALLTHFNELGC